MILTLEQQVCSLESAKRLKDLGVRQESLFYWEFIPPIRITELADGKWIITDKPRLYPYYSAYTVAELGELLPCYRRTHKLSDGRWTSESQIEIHNTEAEARANMLICLLENGLMERSK